MNLKKPQIELIRQILAEFDLQEVNYCLLRNYEFLLEDSMAVESLDTVISKEDWIKTREIFQKYGFTERKQQFSHKHKALFKLTEDLKLVSFDLQIGGVYWNDLQYLDEGILKSKQREDYFNILSEDDFVIMLIIHSILGKRKFKAKYQQQLLEKIDLINQNYLINKLSSTFGDGQAKKIIFNIKNNQFNNVSCKKLILTFLLGRPERLITLLRLTGRWIKQRKNPFLLYPLISIIGPDGAGKTTMVQQLSHYLQENNRKTAIIYTGRGKGNILPFSTVGRKYKQAEKKTDKNLIKKNHWKTKFIYTMASPIFAADLYLRYWLKIFPKRWGKTIVITDRYCSDILLMEHVNFTLKKIWWKIFPRPNVTILLYNKPEVLLQRRTSEKLANLERQMKIFEKLEYSIKIKNDEAEETFRKITKTTMNYLLRNWF